MQSGFGCNSSEVPRGLEGARAGPAPGAAPCPGRPWRRRRGHPRGNRTSIGIPVRRGTSARISTGVSIRDTHSPHGISMAISVGMGCKSAGFPRGLKGARAGPAPWAAPCPRRPRRRRQGHLRGNRTSIGVSVGRGTSARISMGVSTWGKSIVRMGSPWDSPCGYSLESLWESAASPMDGSKVPGLAPHPGQPRAPGGPAASPRELSIHGYLSAWE